ncbi:annexin A5-like isoform X4 [Branchiostoma floridae x Branchiostoma japonicum]
MSVMSVASSTSRYLTRHNNLAKTILQGRDCGGRATPWASAENWQDITEWTSLNLQERLTVARDRRARRQLSIFMSTLSSQRPGAGQGTSSFRNPDTGAEMSYPYPGGGYPGQGMPQPGYPSTNPPYPGAAPGYPQGPAAMPMPGAPPAPALYGGPAGYDQMPAPPGGPGLPYSPQPPLGFQTVAMAATAFRGGAGPVAMPTPQPPGPAPYPSAGGGAPPYPVVGGGTAAPPMPQAPPPASGSFRSAPPPQPHSSVPSAPGSQRRPPPQVPTAPGGHRAAPTQPTPQSKAGGASQTRHKYGTLREHQPFDPHADGQTLRNAMRGVGTDEKAIIDIMAHRSNDQRQKIILQYKTMYGKDLIDNLKSDCGGRFGQVIHYLCMTPARLDAYLLRNAIKGFGTDEKVLIEILTTRTNQELTEIKIAYNTDYNKNLEQDIIDDTSGHFKRLMVSLAQGNRSENTTADMAQAQREAKELYDAGEKKWGTDESKFNAILVSRSPAQLRATFDEYSKLCKYTMEQSIKREMSGDLEKGMLAIVKSARDTPAFFAEKLYKSMKGLGTDDDTLIRIVVSRCEVDMQLIKQAFQANYKQTLGRFIAGDTSGDYQKILLALIGGKD